MKRIATAALAVACVGFAVFWWLSAPAGAPSTVSSALENHGDPESGETVFWASGCASCHSDKGAKGEGKLLLGGGHRLETPFGTFVTPNISPDAETGIGNWSISEFAIAMRNGVSPDGRHYYPSFPYTSYNKMTDQDLADLFAYMKKLPEVDRANEPHELALPFRWRRTLGIWKRLFVSDRFVVEENITEPELVRGRYLVEVLGHCGECHTPRNLLGGYKSANWLAGGPAPEGEGRIPNITPHDTAIGGWSANDIAYYLESGFTPDYDSVGGSMVSVQENMAKLPATDREAIAAYLKEVSPVK